MKAETELSSELAKRLTNDLTGSVVFKISDHFTPGVPDLAVNWIHTTWLEVKATADGKIRWHRSWGKQLLTARRLERATLRCWFIIYEQVRDTKRTVIARPRDVQQDLTYVPLEEAPGHDHTFIRDFIIRLEREVPL